MDADDPLNRLAQQLERLSAANVTLGEAMERLATRARITEHPALDVAADEARAAARTAAAASARVQAMAEHPAP